MTTFDDREKSFENKYSLDSELAFKINARRNKLLGRWAAEKLGKTGPDAEQYAKDVVMSDFQREGDDDVVEKLLQDFTQAGMTLGEKDIRTEMERLMPVARKQIMEDQK
jgi:hypothetical protein